MQGVGRVCDRCEGSYLGGELRLSSPVQPGTAQRCETDRLSPCYVMRYTLVVTTVSTASVQYRFISPAEHNTCEIITTL